MLMITLLLGAAAAASGPCDAATSTTAMVSCLDGQAQRADARLNTAYRDARARASAGQTSALQLAQRAWIAFRDANCRAYASSGGTVARVEAARCRLDITASRAEELERFARRS